MGLPCDRKEVGLGNAFTFCSARIWAASETGFPPNFIKQANYGQLSDMFLPRMEAHDNHRQRLSERCPSFGSPTRRLASETNSESQPFP